MQDFFAQFLSFLWRHLGSVALFLLIIIGLIIGLAIWKSPEIVKSISDYKSARVDDKIKLQKMNERLNKKIKDTRARRRGML